MTAGNVRMGSSRIRDVNSRARNQLFIADRLACAGAAPASPCLELVADAINMPVIHHIFVPVHALPGRLTLSREADEGRNAGCRLPPQVCRRKTWPVVCAKMLKEVADVSI
ncbi:MAG: hypothetical protein ACHQAY_03040 [Hyphomicrobiales bacterium]